MTEEWKPSPVFGNFYEVSNFGRVRSPKGIKKPYHDKDGYPTVNLHSSGQRKACNIHRLVCRAFHGESVAPWREAAHLDGVRMNCRADNLKWVGKVQNHFHMRAHGTHLTGEKHGRSKLKTSQAVEIGRRARGGESATKLGREFGVNERVVRDIRDFRLWRSAQDGTAPSRSDDSPVPKACAQGDAA